jgi:hypothetical protein
MTETMTTTETTLNSQANAYMLAYEDGKIVDRELALGLDLLALAYLEALGALATKPYMVTGMEPAKNGRLIAQALRDGATFTTEVRRIVGAPA